MKEKFLVTNFAYGTGPYLRTTNLAIAFNNEFEKASLKRLGIIVPWVYGEKQKKVMLEEFSGHLKKYPDEILLDAKLGLILKSVFYGDNYYQQALSQWINSAETVSRKIHNYLSGILKTENFSGKKKEIAGKDIVVELNRSPRISYKIAPAYFTSFGYIEQILKEAQSVEKIDIEKNLLKRGVETAKKVEENQQLHCIAYPGTFSFGKNYQAGYQTEILVPPIAPPPLANEEQIEKGIFVTITGIPGLERLYSEAKELGLKLYSNDPKAVPGSVRALPRVISNKNIIFQFARSGWSSVWISMISGTPLVIPDFDSKDDPEIYFNNKAIEKLGIGIIYRGQPLKEILRQTEKVRKNSQVLKNQILNRWGTLDGNQYCAKLFVEHFLNNFSNNL